MLAEIYVLYLGGEHYKIGQGGLINMLTVRKLPAMGCNILYQLNRSINIGRPKGL